MSGWIVESGVEQKWTACREACTAETVPADKYAEASICLITVFDVIGAAMKIPKDDMMGNATAMQKFSAAAPGKTVQELCEADIAETGGGDAQKAIKKEGVTVKLLWLSRAMRFIQILLQALVADAEASLSDCVRKAYEGSLKQHHGMIVKGVFAAAVRAAPYRSSFMLGLAPTEAEALAKLGEMLPLIEYINKVNEAFLESKGLPL